MNETEADGHVTRSAKGAVPRRLLRGSAGPVRSPIVKAQPGVREPQLAAPRGRARSASAGGRSPGTTPAPATAGAPRRSAPRPAVAALHVVPRRRSWCQYSCTPVNRTSSPFAQLLPAGCWRWLRWLRWLTRVAVCGWLTVARLQCCSPDEIGGQCPRQVPIPHPGQCRQVSGQRHVV